MSLASDIVNHLKRVEDIERKLANGGNVAKADYHDVTFKSELLLRRALVMAQNVAAIKAAVGKVAI